MYQRGYRERVLSLSRVRYDGRRDSETGAVEASMQGVQFGVGTDRMAAPLYLIHFSRESNRDNDICALEPAILCLIDSLWLAWKNTILFLAIAVLKTMP